MANVLAFLSENSGWLFGGSSVTAIVVGLVRYFFGKRATAAPETRQSPGTVSSTTVAGRDIVYNNDASLKIVQYAFVLIAFIVGIFVLSVQFTDDDPVVTNQITGGDGSTNIISTGGSNVSTD